MKSSATVDAIEPVTNGAKHAIVFSEPYRRTVTVEGVAPFLFHAWNPEAVKEKGTAAKGSRAKKEDNIESYVVRDDRGGVGIPGEYFRQSMLGAAKFMQDPRSPRKSAVDLYKAGIVMGTELCALGKKTWDYLDQRRVMVQRNGVNRVRPALLKGWRCTFDVEVILPEYIQSDHLIQAIGNAGRLIGVGDFRPTYGRYVVVQVK
jgi:hypothetical protein